MKPTRLTNNFTGKQAALDQAWSNKPEKITSVITHCDTFSDHKMVEINRHVKGIVNTRKYIKVRSFKNFNNAEYNDRIVNHSKFIETHYENDVQVITNNIIEIVKDALDATAPVKTIQINSKNQTKTVRTMQNWHWLREMQLERYIKQTNSQQDEMYYRQLKHKANGVIAKDRNRTKYQKFKDNIDKNNKQQWKVIKEETGQNNKQTPRMIIEDNIQHKGQKKIAQSLNVQYLKKVNTIIENLEAQN